MKLFPDTVKGLAVMLAVVAIAITVVVVREIRGKSVIPTSTAAA